MTDRLRSELVQQKKQLVLQREELDRQIRYTKTLQSLLSPDQLRPNRCFNFNTLELGAVDTYLKQEGNLVLVATTTLSESPAICTSISREKKNLTANINIYWECKGPRQFPKANPTESYIKISIEAIQIYVKAQELKEKLDTNPKIIFFVPSGKRLKYTASATALVDVNYMSADHCQEGTSKEVWKILDMKDTKRGPSVKKQLAAEKTIRELQATQEILVEKLKRQSKAFDDLLKYESAQKFAGPQKNLLEKERALKKAKEQYRRADFKSDNEAMVIIEELILDDLTPEVEKAQIPVTKLLDFARAVEQGKVQNLTASDEFVLLNLAENPDFALNLIARRERNNPLTKVIKL